MTWGLTRRRILSIGLPQLAVIAVTVIACLFFLSRKVLKTYQGDVWEFIETDDLELIKRYAERGGNLNACHDIHIATPLVFSATQDRTAAFNLLLRLGADPNARIYGGRKWTTVMHQLSKQQETKWLVSAIKHGGDVTLLNSSGESLLDIAMSVGSLDGIEVLLEQGANPCPHQPGALAHATFLEGLRANTPNLWPGTPRAVQARRIFTILLQRGIDPDSAIWSGDRWVPGDVDARREAVLLWQSAGRQDLAEDAGGNNAIGNTTLLHYALLMDQYDAALEILRRGADPNVDYNRPGRDSNYMRSASHHSDPKWLARALEYGGDANLADRRFHETGETLLMSAVYGDIECIRLLVNAGSRLCLKTKSSRTALSYISG